MLEASGCPGAGHSGPCCKALAAHSYIYTVSLLLTACILYCDVGEISLDMIWKRLEDIQADMLDVPNELGSTNENVAAIARSQVTMQRDIRIIHRDLGELKDPVTVLTVAVDDHPTSNPAHSSTPPAFSADRQRPLGTASRVMMLSRADQVVRS